MFSLLPSTSSWMTENLLSTQGELRFLRLPPGLPGLRPGSWAPALASLADLSSISRAVSRCGLGLGDCWASSFLKSWSEVFLGVIDTDPEFDIVKQFRAHAIRTSLLTFLIPGPAVSPAIRLV